MKELKDSIALMMQRNTKLATENSKPELKSENFYYEEIKLETEEQNRKFLSEMNDQNIEIKMETPTAPVEDENNSNAIVHNFSDSNIPTVLVKSEVIESKISVTKIS